MTREDEDHVKNRTLDDDVLYRSGNRAHPGCFSLRDSYRA
jgi:hypothetical protein